MFWESMKGEEQKIWYTNEIYSMFRFGINTVDKVALQALRTKDRRKAPKILDIKGEYKKAKFMKDNPRYDILSCLDY